MPKMSRQWGEPKPEEKDIDHPPEAPAKISKKPRDAKQSLPRDISPARPAIGPAAPPRHGSPSRSSGHAVHQISREKEANYTTDQRGGPPNSAKSLDLSEVRQVNTNYDQSQLSQSRSHPDPGMPSPPAKDPWSQGHYRDTQQQQVQDWAVLEEAEAEAPAAIPSRQSSAGQKRPPSGGSKPESKKFDHTRNPRQTQHVQPLHRLLDFIGASSVFDVLEKFEAMITAIHTTARFLQDNVEYKQCDSFQEELERAGSAVADSFGEDYAQVLDNLSGRENEDKVQIGRPDPVFFKIFMQVFIVHQLCRGAVGEASEFDPSCTVDIDSDTAELWDRSHHEEISSSEGIILLSSFKQSFLQMLANIFKLADWAIISLNKRREFEDVVEKLFESGQSLKKAMSSDASSHWDRFEVGVVTSGSVKLGAASEYLDVWTTSELTIEREEKKRASDDDDSDDDEDDRVFGTMLPGLKIVIAGGRSETQVKCLVRPQVILDRMVEAAIKRESERPTADSRGDGRASP